MLRSLILIIAIIFLLPGILFSQRTNRLNKNQQRTGKWIVYSDKEKTKKLFEGRFRNGNAVGRAYYYTMDGVMERKEISRFKKLHTTIYYPDGKIKHKGKARIVNQEKSIRYYFYGKWEYYKPDGQLEKYCYYDKGHIVRTEYLDKNVKTNDSLVFALNALDKHFNEFNKQLLDSISFSRYNALRRERLQMELFMTDTFSYNLLSGILKNYGYPSKEKASEAVMIPFYILSFAPAQIKEDNLSLLKAAADKGDISWKSLAFYIDKMKLEQGKKQVYGTQYYFSTANKKYENVYFPIEDPENLDARRKQIGLTDE